MLYKLRIYHPVIRAKIILRDDSGSYNYYQIRNQDGSFYIRNSAQGRNDISVLSTGKVGIATDDPQSQFEVFGTSPIIRSKHKTSQKYTQINHNGTDGYLDWSSGGLVFRGASNTERLRITSTGVINCGHGDAVNLHGSTTTGINLNGNGNSGQIVANASSNRPLILGRQTDYGTLIEFFQGSNTQEAEITIPAADTFAINTGGTERLRIASDGVITGRGELRLTEGTGAVSNGDEIGSLMFTYPSNDNKNAKIVALQNAGTSGADLAFFTRTQGDGTNADGGEERLRITSAGLVGIGTDDPSWGVSTGLIVGDGASAKGITIFSNSANVGDLAFADATSGTARYRGLIRYDHSDNSLALRTNSSEALRITSAGNVGIGITNPVNLLHLKSTGAARIHIEADSDNAGGENDNPRISFSQDGSGNNTTMFQIGLEGDANATMTNTLANAAIISADNHAAQPLQLGHMGNAFMTLRNDLVGIGTNNPLNGLDVDQSEGRLRVNRFSHLLMQNKNDSTTDYWGISARNGGELDIGYGTPDGNSLIGGDKLTITSSGDVGIGTATPSTKLEVQGDVTATNYVFEADYPTSAPALDLNFAERRN